MTSNRSTRVIRFVFDNSLLLVAGTVAAWVWANDDEENVMRLIWSGRSVRTHSR